MQGSREGDDVSRRGRDIGPLTGDCLDAFGACGFDLLETRIDARDSIPPA